jgi:N-acetylglucosaminyldiphosphoundecaprenol N-acetyl-beta-D-mannosaminyltransferase
MDIRILGVRVHQIRQKELLRKCRIWLEEQGSSGRLHQITTVNPEFIMEAQKNEEFRNVLNMSDCAIADGIGLFFASVFLYGWRHRLFRVTGVDVTWSLAEMCASMGKSMYLLGGAPGVARCAAEVLQKKYPALQIVGAHEGIPKGAARPSITFHEDLCKAITDAAPDVLLVALGSPKQDIWIAEHASLLPTVVIAMGVGGTLDYIAGIVPYAPRWIRTIGLEWIYRLVTQPRRWRRIVTAVVLFPLAVIRNKFVAHTSHSPHSPHFL